MKTVLLEPNKIIEEQNRLLEEKNKSITDSLNYAKLIQNAITHKNDALVKVLPQSFILEMPLEIVSGDFVRVDEKPEKIVVALADCTGHGIPGALMSMIGCAILNGIVNCRNKTMPSAILRSLNIKLKQLTSQATIINDGMDIGLCSIDLKNMELVFAGAHRPLYLIRDNNLVEIKGDNLSIGHQSDWESEFNDHTVKLKKNDTLYMFSDGYTDQFGGEKGKKFSTKKFKEVLLSIQHLNMEEQREYLNTTLLNWKKNLAQVDDICVLGVRI